MKKTKKLVPGSYSGEAERLAQVIQQHRKALGLTQLELSRFAGCGVAFLYQLENGKPTVRLDKLLAVLQVLGLELRVVLGKNGVSVDENLQ